MNKKATTLILLIGILAKTTTLEPVNNFFIGGSVYAFVLIDETIYAEHGQSIRFGNFYRQKEFQVEVRGFDDSYCMFRIPDSQRFILFSNDGKITELKVGTEGRPEITYTTRIKPDDRFFSTFWVEKIKGKGLNEVLLAGYYSSFIVRYNYANFQQQYFNIKNPISELSASQNIALLIFSNGGGLVNFNLLTNTITQDVSYLVGKGITPVSVANYGIYDECDIFLIRTSTNKILSVDLGRDIPFKLKTIEIENDYTFSLDYIPKTHYFVTNNRNELWFFNYLTGFKKKVILRAEVFRFLIHENQEAAYLATGDSDGRVNFEIIGNWGCHFSCKECLTGVLGNKCLICNQGFEFNEENKTCESKCKEEVENKLFNIKSSLCVKNCPQGTSRINEFVCETCKDENCKKCSSSGECEICNPGYLTINGECVENDGETTCPSQSFLNDDNSCQKCQSNCDECTGIQKNQCKKCFSEYNQSLESMNCVGKCKTKEFFDEDTKTCNFCDSACKSCNSRFSFHCTSCEEGRFYIAGQCLDNCPQGYVKSEKGNICELCNGEDCPPCGDEEVIVDGRCREQCPEAHFVIRGICSPCPSNCVKCKDSDECEVCEDGYEVTRAGSCLKDISPSFMYLVFFVILMFWTICIVLYCRAAKKKSNRRRRRNPNERDAITHAMPVEAFDEHGDRLPSLVDINMNENYESELLPEVENLKENEGEEISQSQRDKILKKKKMKMSFLFQPEEESNNKDKNKKEENDEKFIPNKLFQSIIKGEDIEEIEGDGKIKPYEVDEEKIKDFRNAKLLEKNNIERVKPGNPIYIKPKNGDQGGFDFGENIKKIEVKNKESLDEQKEIFESMSSEGDKNGEEADI